MSVAGAFRVMLSEMVSIGVDPAAVCGQAGVDQRVLQDDGAPLDAVTLTTLLARAEAMAGDPLLGLHMAERAQGRGVLSYLARSQQTVGDGLDAFQRYAGVAWNTPDAITIVRDGPVTTVRFGVSPVLSRHVLEYLVARTAMSLRRSGAGAEHVAFTHAAAGTPAEYGRVLRCPVRFRQRDTALVLRTATLARPLRAANPEAAAALAGAITRTRPPATVAAQLARAVEACVVRGDRPDRETLARTLGMSGRTLARRLVAEQRLFRDVVDDVRRLLAQRLVDDPSLDLGEVAARVGFADPAAFGKAFRRWFGTSPSAFRRTTPASAGSRR
jgi:AraC-like DNA-binding protein